MSNKTEIPESNPAQHNELADFPLTVISRFTKLKFILGGLELHFNFAFGCSLKIKISVTN